MNRPSDLDTRLAAWLQEGATRGPDEVLSSVLAQARATRQERVWLGRLTTPRMQRMSTMVGLTAAAILVLAAGVALRPIGDTHQQGASAPSPSPSPSATPAQLRSLVGPPGTTP